MHCAILHIPQFLRNNDDDIDVRREYDDDDDYDEDDDDERSIVKHDTGSVSFDSTTSNI